MGLCTDLCPITIICTDTEFEHAVNDALMRFFDKCTKFVEDVDKNPSALIEVDKFKNGSEMRRVQEKIADRLGVPYSNITHGKDSFNICVFISTFKCIRLVTSKYDLKLYIHI